MRTAAARRPLPPRDTALLAAMRQLEARAPEIAKAFGVLVRLALKELDAQERQRLSVLPFDRPPRRRRRVAP